MNCPHCKAKIDEAEIASYLGSKGGKSSSRKLTSRQAKRMVDARERKRFAPGDTVLVISERRRAKLVRRCNDVGGWQIDRLVAGLRLWNEDDLRLVKKASA